MSPVTLITGASSGIGAALAREVAARGHRVGLLARRAERLEALAESLRAAGHEAAWAMADVRDGEALARGLDRLADELGGADVVVANAGFGRPEKPRDFRPGRAFATYDVNLLGFLRTADWALPRFLDRGAGHLVGIASVASYTGLPHAAAYSGSKAAMRIHLQSLRVSLRRKGIAVTTVCPGFVATELVEGAKQPLPFLWSAQRAAQRIAKAIERREGEVVFPWAMKAIFAVETRLPNRLREWLLGRVA